MACLYPAEFHRFFKRGNYRVRNRGLVVCLISNQEGVVRNNAHIDKLRQLPAFCDARVPGPGRNIVRTIDQMSSPGMVYLVHHDDEVIRRSYEMIRELETSGLYELE
jgi:hypothetical protein